ncbi:hypothetical protein SELMODRAFT_415327 [Selaginella moellendorffii]|uniref:Uncharacterized protein n=1 Tax=Selaginella moellendorffii TaxID=88036 RepID=D8RVS1_SELML|nr:uncharacterized protein LOC9629081 [Selaginella moellendorffii]EFJ24006.1 hypothetical protein SELMODRAFT_415327 [Selaginella moellendorffii]|eukprot:XP_002975221.1 uncharacterized protein LOC9629081 [Selaginella moellendorffii]
MVMAAAGLLAASIVVFAPLAMAGWHITRNRVLFFSTIFFIILAAAVHILPYAPSLSRLVSSFHSTISSLVLSSSSSPSSNLGCLHSLYAINFFDDSDDEEKIRWAWTRKRSAAISACKFRELHREEALEFLSGTWIVVAGDSQARYFLLSLLELLLEDPAPLRSQLFKFHSDFSHTLEDEHLRVDFFWAPYAANLTSKLLELQHSGNGSGSSARSRSPDVIIAGAGLWHMLHVSDPSDYGASLRDLAAAARSLRAPHLFWLNLPVLVPGLLNTAAKREKMTAPLLSRYDEELGRSNLTLPGGDFRVLDVKEVSSLCGRGCTGDGMHYASAVYGALVQIMLQTLVLIRTSS